MTLKEYYKQKLLENADPPKSFADDIISAVRQHVDDPERIISSERGDDFSVFDHARSAADAIEYHMKNPDKELNKDKHTKRLEWLKRTLSPGVVDNLMTKHFGK